MNTAEEVDFKNLQDAHDYYYKEMSRTAKQIDTLCVKSAHSLNTVRYKLLKKWETLSQFDRAWLLQEKESLEKVLRHFHGELDEEYIRGHNLGPDKYWQD